MTGVAAILRYPMQGLDDIQEDSDLDSEEEAIKRAKALTEPRIKEDDEEPGSAAKVSELDSQIDALLDGEDFDLESMDDEDFIDEK